MNIVERLKNRDIFDCCSSGFENLAQSGQSVYMGIDPTAPSLHLGSLQGLIVLKAFQEFGFKVVLIVGGFTGLIGDPSGKSKDRVCLELELVESNFGSLSSWLKKFMGNDVTIFNNAQWLQEMNLFEYLSDVGRFFRVGTMIAKDSVKSRINSEFGISYTEFSYQLLQAYDFYYLFKEHGVTIQVGGSDQWGNITAGCEFIRKKLNKQALGLTYPLLTKEDGSKFGKTESGAIWLNNKYLSEFSFYQSLINLPESMSNVLLTKLTKVDRDELSDATGFELQRLLAQEVTKLIHGEEGLNIALRATRAIGLFGGELILDDVVDLVDQFPCVSIQRDGLIGLNVVDMSVKSGLICSRSRARDLVKSGSVRINDRKIYDVEYSVVPSDILSGKVLVFGVGKKRVSVFNVL